MSIIIFFHGHSQASTQVIDPESSEQAIQKVDIKGKKDEGDGNNKDIVGRLVVGREEILRYADSSVADILKRIPGVTVVGGAVQLRGLGSGYTQILVNGEQVPSTFTIDLISPDTIERIEVVRTGSAESSTQAIAGSINLILKRAVSTAERQFTTGGGLSRGMDEAKVGLLLSDQNGNFSYSLPINVARNGYNRPVATYEWERSPSGQMVYDYVTRRSDNGAYSLLNFAPRLNWKLVGGDTFSSQTFVSNTENQYLSANITDILAGSASVDPLVRMRLHTLNLLIRTELNWVHKFANEYTLDSRITLHDGQFQQETNQKNYDVAGITTLRRDVTTTIREYGLTTTGKSTTPIDAGYQLAFGWDAGVARNHTSRTQSDDDAVGTPERYRAQVTHLSLYGQSEWRVDSALSMNLGARWEHIDISSRGIENHDNIFDTSVFSPVIHGLFKIPNTKADKIRLALTRTFKAPETSKLLQRRFLSTFNSASNPDYIGNHMLRPELATGVDIAYERTSDRGDHLSVSAAARSISDRIGQAVILEQGRWVSYPLNDGLATVYTFEVAHRFGLQALFPAAPNIDMRWGLTRNWSRVANVPGPNNRLAQQIPLSATLGMDFRKGTITMGGAFAYRAGAATRVSLNDSTYSYRRRDLDIYLLWQFAPNCKLRIAASNLLRENATFSNSYTDATATRVTNSVSTGSAWLRATFEIHL